MDLLLNNAASLLFGVVLPVSTVTALAIGCGDNRQPVHKRKKQIIVPQQANKQPANVPSSKRHRSRSKSDKMFSQKGSSSKRSDGSSKKQRSKKHRSTSQKSNPMQVALKGTSNKLKDAKVEWNYAIRAETSKLKPLPTPNKTTSKVAEELKSSAKKQPSMKETQSSKKASEKHDQSVPVYAAGSTDVRMEPHELLFKTGGGIHQITVHNQDSKGQRQAVKVKCSDNGLYRVNPVYAFVEPGKNTTLSVYRNSSAASELRTEKLVLVTVKVPNEETDPMNAFKDRRDNQPKMVIPLLVSSD